MCLEGACEQIEQYEYPVRPPVNGCLEARSSEAGLKPGQNLQNNSAHIMSSTAAWRTQRKGQWEHSRAARQVGSDLRTRSRTPDPVPKTSAQHAAHHHHTPAKLHPKMQRRARTTAGTAQFLCESGDPSRKGDISTVGKPVDLTSQLQKFKDCALPGPLHKKPH